MVFSPTPPPEQNQGQSGQSAGAQSGEPDFSSMSTPELLQYFAQQQAEMRQEIAAAREEIAAARPQVPAVPAERLSAEELLARRMSEIQQHKFYCPGCGRLVDYQQQCRGTNEKPHQATEVVSTDELLANDPAKLTPALPSVV